MKPSNRRFAVPHLLLLVACAIAAAAPAQRVQPDRLVIADFEGGKAETVSGLALWLYTDEQFGGTSEARASIIHPGADGSRGALRVAFHVTNDARASFAGAWAMVGPEGLATDLSAYKGVRFYARSKDGSAFTAGIVRFAGAIIRYTAPFEVRPEWTLVELPFDAFRPVPPPGAPAAAGPPMDARDVTSIGVSVAPQRRGDLELDLDRLEVYR
jgi:Complex I intermediate-associated protein 30 (CIA30)